MRCIPRVVWFRATTKFQFSNTMDNFPDGVSAPDLTTLSYDETVPYESQVPTHPTNDPERATLLNRIGTTKVYLLSDTAQARFAKVR